MSKFSMGNPNRRRCEASGKVMLSRDEARRAAKTLNSSQQRDRDPVHAYVCRSCGGWHTGHARKRAKAFETEAKRRKRERWEQRRTG